MEEESEEKVAGKDSECEEGSEGSKPEAELQDEFSDQESEQESVSPKQIRWDDYGSDSE
jgi:hypothetical protein